MRRIEAWGTELAMALRREADAQAEAHLAAQRAEEASRAVEELKKRIISASNEETWMTTAEWSAVVDTSARETQVMQRFEDVPCPGPVCAWWNRKHAHSPDGEIWDLEFRSA